MCCLRSLYNLFYSIFNKNADISATSIELAEIIHNFYKYGSDSMINQKTYRDISFRYWTHLNRQPSDCSQHKIPTDFCYIDKNFTLLKLNTNIYSGA